MIKLPVSGMSSRRRLAVNVGGSIVAPEEIDTDFLMRMAGLLRRAAEERDLLVVVGGGRTARRYIEACRGMDVPEERLDLVGIDATRLNARLLITAIGSQAYEGVPEGVDEALEASLRHPVVVMGGTRPGQTTDAVSAELAKFGGAEELVILTNVDGVYSDDPRRDPDAVRIPRLTTPELVAIVTRGDYRAGSNAVVDPVAANIILQEGITTKVLDGRGLDQVAAALSGDDFVGTLVVPTE